jgi:hypothetical protein
MTFEQFQATKATESREAYAAKIGVDPEFITAATVLTYFDASAFDADAAETRRRRKNKRRKMQRRRPAARQANARREG